MTASKAAALWFDDPELAPYGTGHIHDTFVLTDRGARYILQRINEEVFRNADLLVAQSQRVIERWSMQEDYIVPALVLSQAGRHVERVDGALWRVWRYVEGTRVLNVIENDDQARSVAEAFSAFQSCLQTLTPTLEPTIDGFLRMRVYLAAFDRVADEAPVRWRTLIERHRDLSARLERPNSHIHGDCKVDNALFAIGQDRVVALIDFDTAMYGHWAWDFGDLVRSVCHSRGRVDDDLFAACVEGFARHQQQVNVLDCVDAPAYLALMLGIRFLTDHLNGNPYFRVDVPGTNLHRAEEQFELFEAMLRQRSDWEAAARVILRDQS